MADVVLVQPIVGLIDNIKSSPGLPISLLSAVKLICREFSVKVIDQRLDKNWSENLKRELKSKPLIVGTTTMLGPEIKNAIKVGNLVASTTGGIPVVVGGPCASVLPSQAIKSGAFDIVLKGDGEISFLRLVNRLAKNRAEKRDFRSGFAAIDGLTYKDNSGKICETKSPSLVDLNKMPDLPYSLVDVNDYLSRRGGVPSLDMETSRGCPFSCRFCYNPIYNMRRWRALRPNLVLERLSLVKERFGVKGIFFVDDEFFIDLKRAGIIIKGIKQLGIRWDIQGVTVKSVAAMSNKYLQMLAESGCEQINIGAESGSDRILKWVKKGICQKDILDINRKLKNFPIMPWYYFMIGFPTETKKEREATISLINRLLLENPRAKISGIGCYTPYPGTELFEESKKYGYLPPNNFIDWSSYAVDNINVPWVNGHTKKEIMVIQFASFFVDQKARDIAGSWWIKILAFLYRPIARYRFINHFYRLPLDVLLGNLIKKRYTGL